MSDHPVRLVVHDDLRRSRLTVFFRLLLAIPHFIWFIFFSIGALVVAIVGWFAALFIGRLPEGMHDFLSNYVRYVTHLWAYVSLIANPYPSFAGDESYDLDVILPSRAQPLARWRVFFRILLALPAGLIGFALAGGGNFFVGRSRGSTRTNSAAGGGGLLSTVAVLGWFSSLARGRMPRGLRDAGAYALGYRAQSLAYFLLLTDAYPNADPTTMLDSLERPPVHPVRLVGDPDDLRRSRVTVFFRLPLAIPHLIWLTLWEIVVFFCAIAQWAVTTVRGRPAAPLHRFLSRYVRQALHVQAFLFLTANPFPGFTGEQGRYPIDVELPAPGRQNRWTAGFRLLLAVPAILVNSALGLATVAAAFLMWFVALLRGSAPWGLRNLSAYSIRYSAQVTAYVLFVTETYPHASPLEGAEPEPAAEPVAAVAAA
jgi:hypothetical protein